MVLEATENCVPNQGHAIARDRSVYGLTRQSFGLPSGPAIATAPALFTFIDDSNHAEDPARVDVTGIDGGAFSFARFLLSRHGGESRVIKELSDKKIIEKLRSTIVFCKIHLPAFIILLL